MVTFIEVIGWIMLIIGVIALIAGSIMVKYTSEKALGGIILGVGAVLIAIGWATLDYDSNERKIKIKNIE